MEDPYGDLRDEFLQDEDLGDETSSVDRVCDQAREAIADFARVPGRRAVASVPVDGFPSAHLRDRFTGTCWEPLLGRTVALAADWQSFRRPVRRRHGRAPALDCLAGFSPGRRLPRGPAHHERGPGLRCLALPSARRTRRRRCARGSRTTVRSHLIDPRSAHPRRGRGHRASCTAPGALRQGGNRMPAHTPTSEPFIGYRLTLLSDIRPLCFTPSCIRDTRSPGHGTGRRAGDRSYRSSSRPVRDRPVDRTPARRALSAQARPGARSRDARSRSTLSPYPRPTSCTWSTTVSSAMSAAGRPRLPRSRPAAPWPSLPLRPQPFGGEHRGLTASATSTPSSIARPSFARQRGHAGEEPAHKASQRAGSTGRRTGRRLPRGPQQEHPPGAH
jgi:hypothetical protein